MKFSKSNLIALCNVVAVFFGVLYSNLFAQSFPAGFSQVQLCTGVNNPTCMAFANDGRIFIGKKNGEIVIFKNGALNALPFASISTSSSGERGLLGMALDPDFDNNHYVYIYYTLSSGIKNRIARITANGDYMVPGSEVLILSLDPLSTSTNHNGGCLKFGVDGKLYVAVGDNNNSVLSQDLNSYFGKLLRINPNGTAPNDNPFISGTAQKKRIWGYGFRNPFTFDIEPVTGRIMVNDVGLSSWEEINDATLPAQNFGWPNAEGAVNNINYSDPLYAYEHGGTDQTGCAITSGVFFNPASTNYPANFIGHYFFSDYCNAWINVINPNNGAGSHATFATSLSGSPVALSTGTDGNLYYLSRDNQALYKIIYTPAVAPPVINVQPANVTASPGQNVTFSISASSSSTMYYAWYKNNVSISGANNSTYSISNISIADSGNYKCVITNSAGSVTSNVAKLTVTNNTPPVAIITTPVNGSYYSGGELISFSGTGIDAESGILSASAFSWNIEFHHDSHFHPGPGITSGVKSGTFTIPNTGEVSDNVFYRLYLTVTDPSGASSTTYVDIVPRKSIIYLYTDPPGLSVNVDGIPTITPVAISSVEGVFRSIAPTSPQQYNSNTYIFDHWNTSGSTVKTFATPSDDTMFTATYTDSYRLPDNPASITSGVYYKYYLGNWDSLPDFKNLTPDKKGTVSNFSLSPKTVNDYFAFDYYAYIDVPSDGLYTFYLSSDDGSKLSIGNTVVVDNDGSHAQLERSGTIGLMTGKHLINVQYFERAGTQLLDVMWSGPGFTKQAIPSSALYRLAGVIQSNVIEDSYVRSGSYSYTYMGQTDIKKLMCKFSTGTTDQIRETYVKFDIDGFTTDFLSVTLDIYGKLRGVDLQSTSFIDCVPLKNNYWHENTLTYANRPVSTLPAITQLGVSDIIGSYHSFDITPYITQCINEGQTIVSLILKATAIQNNYVQWYSKEYGAAFAPRLTFVYTAPKVYETTLNSFTENDIKVYPNPADGILNIFIPLKNETATVNIYNMQGKLLRSFITSNAANSFSVEDFQNGLYYVTILRSRGLVKTKLEILK